MGKELVLSLTTGDLISLCIGMAAWVGLMIGAVRYVLGQIEASREAAAKALEKSEAEIQAALRIVETKIEAIRVEYARKDEVRDGFSRIDAAINHVSASITGVHRRMDDVLAALASSRPQSSNRRHQGAD